MHASDARIARLYTTETGGNVQDSTPNAPATGLQPPATTFDLVLEGEAGVNLGASGVNYTLSIVAYDVTTGDNAPALDPTSPTLPNQEFNAGKPNPLWKASGTDFITEQRFAINVPAAVKKHTISYTASLVSDDGQIVSFLQSEPFILL